MRDSIWVSKVKNNTKPRGRPSDVHTAQESEASSWGGGEGLKRALSIECPAPWQPSKNAKTSPPYGLTCLVAADRGPACFRGRVSSEPAVYPSSLIIYCSTLALLNLHPNRYHIAPRESRPRVLVTSRTKLLVTRSPHTRRSDLGSGRGFLSWWWATYFQS
jgi:hypothetical protein